NHSRFLVPLRAWREREEQVLPSRENLRRMERLISRRDDNRLRSASRDWCYTLDPPAARSRPALDPPAINDAGCVPRKSRVVARDVRNGKRRATGDRQHLDCAIPIGDRLSIGRKRDV